MWSLKHLYSPPEASKLREMEASSTDNMLAAVGVSFGTGFERKWTDRLYRLTTDAACYRFSGVAGCEGCSTQELILRVMEGVARQECLCS